MLLLGPIAAAFADDSAGARHDEPADPTAEPSADPPSETVTVDGARAPSPLGTSASLTVLPLGPAVPPGQDLARVLDSASGTTVRRMGGLGDFATLSLRGSTSRQVEVFLDGVPLNPDGSSVVNLAELPVTAFERVEIYRGNVPASFGAAPIGGVVNLVTPNGRTIPTAVGGAGGSFGTAHVWAIGGPRIGHTDAFFTLDQFHTDGNWRYFDDQGTEFNRFDDRTPMRTHNAIDRTSAIARLRRGPVTMMDAFVTTRQQLSGAISEVVTAARIDTTRNLLVVSGDTRPTPITRLSPRAWWLFREEEYDDPKGEIGVGASHSRDRSHTVGAQLDGTLLAAPWLITAATLRARRESYVPMDVLADRGDGERLRHGVALALSADARFWGERLTVSPVAQGEWLDNRLLGDIPYEDTPVAPTGNDTDIFLLPRLGILLRPHPIAAIRANAGRYSRAPNLTELFGDHGSLIGNTDLVPETGWAFDVGGRVEAPDYTALTGSLDVSFARNHATDLIVYVQNAEDTARAVNLRSAFVGTTEVSLALDALQVVGSQTNLTHSTSRNLDTTAIYANKTLPGLPELEFSQTTSAHWRDRVRLSHTWSYTGESFTDAANYRRTTVRNIHSLAVDTTPMRGYPTLRAEVLNLLDVRGMAVDRDPLNPSDDAQIVKPLTDFSGYPLPGRTVMVAVTWADPIPRN